MNRQQILAVMETDADKSLKDFNAAVEGAVNAGYIIASGKIAKLMQSIASSRVLCDYLARLTQGYTFVETFRSRQFRDEHGRLYIDVPTESAEQMRFAVCLLFALDTGKLRLENLLHNFYADVDPNTEYRMFCESVIEPFAKNLNAAFAPAAEQPAEQPAATEPQESQEPFVPVAETPAPPLELPQEETPNAFSAATFTEPPQELPQEQPTPVQDTERESLLRSLGDVTADIISVIAGNNEINSQEREELLLVCDAFATAVKVKEAKAIRVMYIALKNTLQESRVFAALEQRPADLAYLIAGLGIEA